MDFTLDKKLQGFRQIAQEKLQSILCSIPDSQKDIVIETCLIKPLEHICGASWLRFVFLGILVNYGNKKKRIFWIFSVQRVLIRYINLIQRIHRSANQRLFTLFHPV